MGQESRILKAVEFIEANLADPLSTPEIAFQVHMSLRSLHRHFISLTGTSIQHYVRLRRLTEAAKELTLSRHSVLDTAIKYQFDSYEGFSRSFKNMFVLSPDFFRKTGSKLNALYVYRIEPSEIEENLKGNIIAPMIEFVPEKHLLGFYAEQNDYALPTPENVSINNLLENNLKNCQDINQHRLNDEEWSVCFRKKHYSTFHRFEKTYGCAIKNNISDTDLHQLTVPAGAYAVFQHTLNYSVEHTISRALQWLKHSDYFLNDAPCLYKKNSNLADNASIYLPISPYPRNSFSWWHGYNHSFQ